VLTCASRSLGAVDAATVKKVVVTVTDAERARQERLALVPPLDEILNLHDFEVRARSVPFRARGTLNVRQAIARLTLTDKAWAYYSSAADDEITHRENHAAYHRSAAPRLSVAPRALTRSQRMVPPARDAGRDRG
jgi:L-lactate dehydrogenase (cytochrome)